MSREPYIDDANITAELSIALGQSSNVIRAVTPVVRTAYCNGWYEGFKAGQEEEREKRGLNNGGEE